jgi:hypothetical protein
MYDEYEILVQANQNPKSQTAASSSSVLNVFKNSMKIPRTHAPGKFVRASVHTSSAQPGWYL